METQEENIEATSLPRQEQRIKRLFLLHTPGQQQEVNAGNYEKKIWLKM
jgi:hypothetical protein